MKILTICIPQAGHLNPLLPLLRQFVQDGDEVVVASAEDIRGQVVAAGAEFRTAGQGLPAYFAQLAARTRGRPGDGLPPERISYYFIPRLFAEIAAADMVDDALAVAQEFRPDGVLFDSEAFAGPLVAALSGARPIHHMIGSPIGPDILDLCSDSLSPTWRSFGLERPHLAGLYDGLTVSISPPAFGAAGLPGEVLTLRPAPLPERPAERQDPPLVYVTFGTLWADASLLRSVLTVLAQLDVEVLVTSGQLAPEELGALPANVTVEPFVPQGTVLPRASATINHAGAGTMLGALAHGIPQLLLPQAADNFVNSATLSAAGAAIQLLPDQVDGAAIGQAVERLLRDGGLRARAQQIAAEIAAMPGPEAVAAQLRQMLTG